MSQTAHFPTGTSGASWEFFVHDPAATGPYASQQGLTGLVEADFDVYMADPGSAMPGSPVAGTDYVIAERGFGVYRFTTSNNTHMTTAGKSEIIICLTGETRPVAIIFYEVGTLDVNLITWRGTQPQGLSAGLMVRVSTDEWNQTAVAAPTTAGVPRVDVKVIENNAITTASINNNAFTSAKFANDFLNSNHFADNCFDAVNFSSSVGEEFADFVLDELLAGHAGAGSLGKAISDLDSRLPSDPADASVVADLIAALEAKVDIVDTNVDSILADTVRLKGLLHNNSRDDNHVYTDGRLTSCRKRVFANKAAADASTVGAANNADSEVARYTLTFAYDGDDLLESFKWVQDL